MIRNEYDAKYDRKRNIYSTLKRLKADGWSAKYTAMSYKEKEKKKKTKNNKNSAVAEMGDRLATINIGRKWRGLIRPFLWGELGPHLTQCRLVGGLPPYQVVS